MNHSTSVNQDRTVRQAILDQLEKSLVGAEWLLDVIANIFEPDEVFGEEALDEWATSKGYVKDV